MARLRWWTPSPAMVVACAALLIALGGVSYAAVRLPKNSVGTQQLRNRAVTKAKIARKTISALRGNRGPRGLPGPQGPKGATGAAGAQGPPGPAQSKEARLDGNFAIPTSCASGMKTAITSVTLAGPALYLVNASGYVFSNEAPPKEVTLSLWLYRDDTFLALGQVGSPLGSGGTASEPEAYAFSRLVTVPGPSATISVKGCGFASGTPSVFSNDLVATLTTGTEGVSPN
jgi:hypothetical protein